MLDEFKKLFDKAFQAPKFQTERVFELFLDLEMIADTLAGPLYSIARDGNCDYVYNDKEGRFPGVINAVTFNSWACNLYSEYESTLTNFKVINETEKVEHLCLRDKAEAMKSAISLAYNIQRKREG